MGLVSSREKMIEQRKHCVRQHLDTYVYPRIEQLRARLRAIDQAGGLTWRSVRGTVSETDVAGVTPIGHHYSHGSTPLYLARSWWGLVCYTAVGWQHAIGPLFGTEHYDDHFEVRLEE